MSVVEAIKSGLSPVSIKEELLALEARQVELQRRLTEPEAPPLLHPGVAGLYREKVNGLCQALDGDERSVAGARRASTRRSDEVSLEPDGDKLRIVLKGHLAGMLRLVQQNKRSSETDDLVD
jgi:hypothetical protein